MLICRLKRLARRCKTPETDVEMGIKQRQEIGGNDVSHTDDTLCDEKKHNSEHLEGKRHNVSPVVGMLR